VSFSRGLHRLFSPTDPDAGVVPRSIH
jgi:hypothetical protein